MCTYSVCGILHIFRHFFSSFGLLSHFFFHFISLFLAADDISSATPILMQSFSCRADFTECQIRQHSKQKKRGTLSRYFRVVYALYIAHLGKHARRSSSYYTQTASSVLSQLSITFSFMPLLPLSFFSFFNFVLRRHGQPTLHGWSRWVGG